MKLNVADVAQTAETGQNKNLLFRDIIPSCNTKYDFFFFRYVNLYPFGFEKNIFQYTHVKTNEILSLPKTVFPSLCAQ